MTREELGIVREAATRRPNAPPDLDTYIWLTHRTERRQPLRTWLDAIGVLEKIDQCHTLPFPKTTPAHSAEEADSGSITHHVATTFDPGHQRRKARKAREVRLDDLTYIPLPRAPLRWEE